MFRKQLNIIVFFLFSSTTLLSQSDYEFWFAAPPVTHQFVFPSPILYQNLNHPIRFYFTTSEGPAIVTVSQPANPSFTPIVVTVNNATASSVDLTAFIDNIETKPADSILNWGIHITSNKRVTAQYEVQSPHNAETFALLGRNSLGYEFIIPSLQHYSNYEYSDPPALNTFEVVATEDSTTVKILPKVGIVGHAAHDTAFILLNRGQCWNGSALSGDSTAHLGGSFVFSDKPIAVTVCDDAIHVPAASNNSEDIAGAQLIPRHLSGKEFAFGYNSGFQHLAKIYIYAYENSTSITYNDSARIISRTINRGDSMEIRTILSGIPVGGCYIQSDKPILVVLYSFQDQVYPSGFSSPQAASVIVPPITCGGSRRVVCTQTPPKGKNPEFDMQFITKKTNLSGFSSIPYINFDTNNYNVIPGTFGILVGIGITGNAPLYSSYIITNSKGRFQFFVNTSCSATDTADYSKSAFFSDYSTLYLGVDKKMCPGDSILLDAGYGRDTYIWNTGDTSQTIWVRQPGIYWVHTNEEGNCNLSDTIAISYYSFTPVNLGPDRQICNGDSTLLDAGVGRLWYDWSTGDSTQTIWVKIPGAYWVKVSDVPCPVSDTIILSTTPVPVITNNPLSKSICSGESTNIQLTANIPGATFHWTATLTSGNITGFSADSGIIINQGLINSLVTPGIVTYHITPKVGSCSGVTVDFPVTVNAGDSVKISITASTNNVCAGTPITFTATSTNGGSSPSYQWKVNGNNVGTNSPNYTYNPASGDLVSCILTSSITVCISNNPATSNTVQMVVNPLNPVSITISPFANPVCSGTAVTYTASPTNGGTSPSYQWKVNGINTGTNNPNYTYIPNNGDIVECILTSNILCPTGNPATSNTVTMTVNQNMPVSVSISASLNPVCSGIPVNFTATPVNGGSTPVYQWQVNGGNAGSNSSLYQYTPLNGDLVNCMLTSNLNCTTGNPSTSNTITMNVSASPVVTFTLCNDSITTVNAQPFRLKGGIPLGGTYSGPGVTNGIFYPAIAGVGNHQITYTYTNAALCSANAFVTIVTRNASPVTCGNPITDVRDSKVYPTVQIGSQCWMAEDLNYGTEIPADQAQRDNCLPEKYHNPASSIQHPASVYQWDELMQYDETISNQGLCPPGWHVPTEIDWNTLFANYINNAFAASPLKYSGFSGFNALLSGARHMNKTWDFQGFATFFWSSTLHGATKAWAHGMNDVDPSVSLYPAFRSNAFSVRCLKD